MDKLSEEHIEQCMNAFKDLDEQGTGFIKVTDLKLALERVYIDFKEKELFKMISDVDTDNSGRLSFESFLDIYYLKKVAPTENDQKQDLVDAFVAVGGGPGELGSIDANELIRIIKTEFKMSIDIEKLIEEIDEDGSGEIEFDEFEQLLTKDFTD